MPKWTQSYFYDVLEVEKDVARREYRVFESLRRYPLFDVSVFPFALPQASAAYKSFADSVRVCFLGDMAYAHMVEIIENAFVTVRITENSSVADLPVVYQCRLFNLKTWGEFHLGNALQGDRRGEEMIISSVDTRSVADFDADLFPAFLEFIIDVEFPKDFKLDVECKIVFVVEAYTRYVIHP